jgi:hypothetical protein
MSAPNAAVMEDQCGSYRCKTIQLPGKSMLLFINWQASGGLDAIPGQGLLGTMPDCDTYQVGFGSNLASYHMI